MKVLFVCSGNSIIGISPFILSQGESLRKRGVELDYFTIKERGVKGYIKALFILRNLLRINRYDIVHAHYGLSAIVALQARRKEKIIVSFMGSDLLGSNKPDGSMTRTSLWLSRMYVFLTSKFYDHAIVKSEEMLRKLKQCSSSLIPNGVDLIKFHHGTKVEARSRLGMASDREVIVFAGSPRRVEKNFLLAQRAMDRIAGRNAMMVTVSDQPPDILPEYYNAADVLLLTSYHEGSPNVIKEAMACNCPIVSTDVGDVKWVLGETEGCYLASFDPGNVASKITLALEFAKKNDRTTGRKRIIGLGLDLESIADKIIEVYRMVID